MSNRAGRFGAVLAMLWVAHDLGDHVAQTDHQARTKADNWRGMAGHIGTYHLTQAAALAALRPLGVRPSWRRVLAGMAFSAITHAFLDRRWPVVRLLELTGSPGFARPVVRTVGDVRDVLGANSTVDAVGQLPLHGPYLADQALHHACLAVTAAVIVT